jgi:DNA-binding winged helix-turn-helix (wHTH) protein/tetratricopeptide (TPR) repeat protein
VIYAFADCELDTERFELRRGGVGHHVEPQVFDVLVYLVEHRDRVVTREELLTQVWGHTYVSEATLSSRLMTARKAIGDSGRSQSLIRTVRGRGYQFVGEVQRGDGGPQPAPASAQRPARALIGREEQLSKLESELEAALSSERRTVFVTGEPGVGKTTLVEAFLGQAREAAPLLMGRGFCLDQRGRREPYMPVLEALGRLGGEPAGAPLLEALRTRAPTWLIQLPWLLPPGDVEDVRRAALGATPERMLRELAEALESLTSGTALVLLLEDVHWSDDSTLDLIARLARREEPARLLLVCTYRPGEGPAVLLQRELRVRGRCVELALPFLSREEVHLQLEARLPGGHPSPALAGLVHRRTDGNPLFVEALLDSWLEQGALEQTGGGWAPRAEQNRIADGIPDTLRDLIDQDVSRLSPDDLEVLEAASVVGTTFAAAAVPAPQAEARCSRLARDGRLVLMLGESRWAGGRVSTLFAFIHDLHREVLYRRIPSGRRAELHRELAGLLEAGYGPEAPERAAEIALHSVRGQDAARAVEYLRLAAEQALRRSGYREALGHLGEALEQLKIAGRVAEPDRVELSLQALLGPALAMTEGWSSPGAERALRRAIELSERLGDDRQLAASLYFLAGVMEFRGNHPESEALMARCLAIEQSPPDPSADLEAHELMACSLFHQGKFERAVDHARRGLALFEPGVGYEGPAVVGEHPVVSCHDWAGLALGCLGAFDEAEERITAAIGMADSPGRVHALAYALTHAARLHQLRGDPETVEQESRAALALATEKGFTYRSAVAKMLLGWALAARGESEEGLVLLCDGLEWHRSTGAELDRPYFLGLLAEVSIASGKLEAARSALDEALGPAANGRSFFYEAELHRLRGELELRAGGGLDIAERHFRVGLEVARRQQARALELRAALSLAGAFHAADRDAEAAAALDPLRDWFLAQDGSADLRAARGLHQEVAA